MSSEKPITWIGTWQVLNSSSQSKSMDCGKAVRVAAPAHPCARGVGASLHVIASIEEPALIERILEHVRVKAEASTGSLGPPSTGPPVSA